VGYRGIQKWDQVKDVEIRSKSQQRTHKRLFLQQVAPLCVRRDIGGGGLHHYVLAVPNLL